MKKMSMTLTAILALSLLLFTTACGSDDNDAGSLAATPAEVPAAAPTPSPTPAADEPATDEPDTTGSDEPVLSGFTRGTWNGNVFTSTQFNVTFEMPDGWIAATDAEIADVMGLGLDFLEMTGVELTPETIEMAGITTIQDMMASNPETGAMVQIMAERLFFPNTRITPEEYIEVVSEMMEAMGMEVVTGFPTINMGGRTWHQYQSILDLGIMNIYGWYLLDIQDGFVFIIQFVYSDVSEPLEELLAMIR